MDTEKPRGLARQEGAEQEPAAPRPLLPIDLTEIRRNFPTLMGLGVAMAILVGVPVMVTGLWVLGQFLIQTITLPPKDFEDISRRLLAVGVIVAAPFAIWRIITSHWQARAAQAQAAAADRQVEVSREEHYTSLFTAAVGQLGAVREVTNDVGISHTEPNTEARLGAIYALARIAQDSERDHWPIMETLCAYVRKNAGPPKPIPTVVRERLYEWREDGWDEVRRVREAAMPYVDVQAALNVIGRRSPVRLAYEKKLRAAAPSSSSSYVLDLTRTELSGVVFDGLNFDGAKFDGSNLAFAKFRGTSAREASFDEACALGVDIRSCDFSYAYIGAEWPGANIYGSRLEGIRTNSFSGTLEQCSFDRCDMTAADLEFQDLSGATLTNCNLSNAVFTSATCVATDFTYCNFQGANVENANVDRCRLNSALLSSCKGWDQEMIDACVGDARTEISPDLERPSHWQKARAAWREMREATLQEWRQHREMEADVNRGDHELL